MKPFTDDELASLEAANEKRKCEPCDECGKCECNYIGHENFARLVQAARRANELEESSWVSAFPQRQ